MTLGSAFSAPVINEEDERLKAILHALLELREMLANQPAPVVNLPAPVVNFTPPEVMTPVPALTPQSIDVSELVRAVEAMPRPTDISGLLETLMEKMALLDFRLQGVGTGGGGPPSNSDINQRLDVIATRLDTVATKLDTVATKLDGITTIETVKDRATRTLKFEVEVGEEIRVDDIVAGDRYHGLAADGTATSAASWSVVRFYRDASANITRTRYRANVVWDSRTSGW